MYIIIQADANEPVPPVITSVLSLKASVIVFILVVPLFPSSVELFVLRLELGVYLCGCGHASQGYFACILVWYL